MNQSSASPAPKQVYRVTVRAVDWPTILVEATSEEEAIELAERIDGGFFHADWAHASWDIDGAELATDYDPDQLAPPEAYDSL